MVWLKRTVLCILILLLVWLFLAYLNSGGIETVVKLPEGLEFDEGIVTTQQCRQMTLSTRLSPDSDRLVDTIGGLCWTGELTGKTLQILISGAGYGRVYWDFPYQPDTYSYQRAALKKGYATFNYDRTGIGASDHPFGMWVNVDNHAFVLSQLIKQLNQLADFERVVTVGHSLGSVIAIAHGVHYPGQADGMVLTGYVHNSNPEFNVAMRSGVDLAPLSATFVGDIFDPVYMVSKEGTRQNIFYHMDNVDPLVTAVDEINRQTLTIGEIISMLEYFGPPSKAVDVPVFILTGQEDFVVCGAELDCADHKAVVEHEESFFSEKACVKTVIVENTGHNINLHLNAAESFSKILTWIDGLGSPCAS